MPKRNVVMLLVAVLAALGGYFLLPSRLPDTHAGREAPVRPAGPLEEVLGVIDQRFVAKPDADYARRRDEQTIAAAVRALNDPYSQFYPPEQAEQLADQIAGRFTGAGLAIELRDGRAVVASVLEDSPAAAAGLLPGDVLVGVNDRSLDRLTEEQIARLVRGPLGSTFTVSVRRDGWPAERRVRLARARVAANPVKGFAPLPGGGAWDYLIRPPIGPNIGYIRVSEFVEDDNISTLNRFASAIAELRSTPARALIIDLRDNPGGLWSQAVQMVDMLLADGVIISARSIHGRRVERATGLGRSFDWPIVVLVNEQSASASEIVAGSLAINSRAVLVGTRTYGKGTEQETRSIALPGGGKGILKLTVAYLYLPDGRPFDRVPPGPDYRPLVVAASLRETSSPDAAPAWGVNPTVTVLLSPTQRNRIIECRRGLGAFVPGTQPDDLAPSTQPTPTPPPDSLARLRASPADHLSELLAADAQLQVALAILADPARYHDLLAKAPTTAAE